MTMTLLALGAILFAQTPSDGGPGKPTRARANLQTYFSTDDYPEAAIRRRAEGVTHFSLEIDPEGRPSRCIVTYTSGDPDLDRVTCEVLMTRARFTPARDASGRAVADRISNRLRWVLPDPDPSIPFVQWRMVSSASITSGRIRCQWQYDDDEPVVRDGERCDELVGAEVLLLLRDFAADAELSTVWRFQPDGAPAPTDEAGRGELLAEVAARLSIASDGHVADCRLTRQVLHRQLARLTEAPDMCLHEMVTGPTAFRPAEDNARTRLGAITLKLYLRGGARNPR
jgi:TonB family protein